MREFHAFQSPTSGARHSNTPLRAQHENRFVCQSQHDAQPKSRDAVG